MNTFAPVFKGLVTSSIWVEPYFVRILWITMLVLKDADHVVRYNAFNLSRMANMSEQEVLDGLKILSEPDKTRLEPQPFEGRRISKVGDGWLILNGQHYEDEMRAISRRFYKARKERERRSRKAIEKDALGNGPLPGEQQYVEALKNRGQESADQESQGFTKQSTEL